MQQGRNGASYIAGTGHETCTSPLYNILYGHIDCTVANTLKPHKGTSQNGRSNDRFPLGHCETVPVLGMCGV